MNNVNSQEDYSTTKSVDNSKDDLAEGGSIINLVSEDSYNVMSFIWIGHYVWAIPLKVYFPNYYNIYYVSNTYINF